MLRGEEIWCQLFSEPGAGSDLAGLSTRAERDGDVFVVNGQKIWTSFAQLAKFGILLARTDPDVSKYTGISYFIVPMDLPGIEVRPLRNMAGGFDGVGFCEVFFTDVHVPAANLIGSVNGGWAMAKETLANERVSLSREGLQWGYGPLPCKPKRSMTQSAGTGQVRRNRVQLGRSSRLRPVAAVVSATRADFDRFRDMPGAALAALRFRRAFPSTPGAIDLALALQPVSRRSWSVSAWQSEDDLRHFVRSAAHVAIVRQYGPKVDV